MKKSVLSMGAVLLLALSLAADERHTGGSADRGNAGAGAAAGGASSISSRGISVGQTVTPAPTLSTRESSNSSPSYVSNGYSPRGVATPAAQYVPNLSRTSFVSVNSWMRSEDFFWYLRSYYGINPLYFRRFYRNTEPLLTPQLAKLTLRQPLEWSMKMLASVDELEAMIRDKEAGKAVSREAIATKTDEIRDLAKQIRQDQSLAYFDQRKDKDVLKGMNLDTLAALSQLRELVTSMNTQLKSLYGEQKPFAVSVGSLTQPSFQSLSKGIEKLTKSIENSSRKI